jgi:hypothetical protein
VQWTGSVCRQYAGSVQAVYSRQKTPLSRCVGHAHVHVHVHVHGGSDGGRQTDTACSSKCRAHPFSPGQPLVQGEQGAWSREPSTCSSASRNACTGCPSSQRPRTHRLMVLILHGGGSAARRARPLHDRPTQTIGGQGASQPSPSPSPPPPLDAWPWDRLSAARHVNAASPHRRIAASPSILPLSLASQARIRGSRSSQVCCYAQCVLDSAVPMSPTAP